MKNQRRSPQAQVIKTDIGHFLLSLYDSAYELYHNEQVAERVAAQSFWRKFRNYERLHHIVTRN